MALSLMLQHQDRKSGLIALQGELQHSLLTTHQVLQHLQMHSKCSGFAAAQID